MVYTKGKGFEKYSGGSHKYIRKMKEGKPVDNINKRKQKTIRHDTYLIQNFKTVPPGIPHGLKHIFRGVDLRYAKPYDKDTMYIESKSYMSFSKNKLIAGSFPKDANKIHGTLVLSTEIIPRRTPVIYNQLWGMKSSQPQEKEVLLPPGILIFSKTPTSNRTYNKKYYNVVKYQPYKLKSLK